MAQLAAERKKPVSKTWLADLPGGRSTRQEGTVGEFESLNERVRSTDAPAREQSRPLDKSRLQVE